MNGVGRLYRNELKKMMRQTGFRVTFIVIAALIVVIPVFVNAMDLILDMTFNYYSYYDSIINDPDATASEKAYYTALKESEEFFDDENVGEWLNNLYSYQYTEAKKAVEVYDLFLAGEDADEIESVFYDVISIVQNDDGEYEQDEYIILCEDQNYLKNLSYERTVQLRDAALKYVEQIENIVRANDFDKYIISVISDIDEEISLNESSVAERTAATANLSDSPRALADNKAESMRIEGLEVLKKAYRFIYNNKLDAESWQYRSITYVLSYAVDSYSTYPNYTEDEYAAVRDQYRSQFNDYKEYTNASAESIKKAVNTFARVEFAFENNIPIPESLNTSVKGIWQGTIPTVCTLISVFMIISAGTSVSSEYSSGTIRLLLVRPRKRWKILLSKLMAVLSYSVILMTAAYVLTLAIAVMFNGVGDAFVPDIYSKDGTAYTMSAAVSTFVILAKCTVSGLMYMAFAFMLSAVAGKSVIAIALPFVMQVFSGTIQNICSLVTQYLPLIKYTPLPYFDLSAFAQESSTVSGLSFGIGLAYNIAIIALLLIIAFILFEKKDIKN